ncbi:hypothetical protein NEOKW01_0110 [Nematocida sp. AWRm80]|nr:hypothetical protein NEOKW01_0110 [Nematocida sp. AWRm80]
MKHREILLRLGVLCTGLSYAQAFIADGNLRCRSYGIGYKDCLNSVYRPHPVYDSYIHSFNLPIRKDIQCAYNLCKIALMGTGVDKYISVVKNIHPPGDCICIGLNNCGCEIVADIGPAEEQKTIYTMPKEPQTHMPVDIPMSIRTVQSVHTVNITQTKTATQTVNIEPTPFHLLPTIIGQAKPSENIRIGTAEILSALGEIGYMQQMLSNYTEPPIIKPTVSTSSLKTGLMHSGNTGRFMASPPQIKGVSQQPEGNFITIPFSTVVKTVQITIPSYITTTRTNYVVNTVDNYITNTMTKTATTTYTKELTQTRTTTVTETISDHIERVKFSTIYENKTVTVDKVSILTKSIPKTITVTRTATATTTYKDHIPYYPRHRHRHRPEESEPEIEEEPIQKTRIPKRKTLSPRPVHRPIQVRPSSRYKQSKNIPEINSKSNQMYIVKPEIRSALVCAPSISGCITPQHLLSGQCEMPSSKGLICPPVDKHQTFNASRPSTLEAPVCVNDCEEEVVKTVYVRAMPTTPLK